MQDSFLKYFLKYELSLGWVDDLLSEYPYPERVQSVLQMNWVQYSVGVRAANGHKFSKEYLISLLGSKKKLIKIYEEQLFNKHTKTISTGLIELLTYHHHLKFNYDVFCRELEESQVEDWAHLSKWTSVFLALRPILNDKKFFNT